MPARKEAPSRRLPLNRDRVLRAAIAIADGSGIDVVSMRRLADDLGVVPMALYKHVANKEELLDGMVEIVIGEIDPPMAKVDWKPAVRQRILSARRLMLRHPWARGVLETRTSPTPTALAYMDSFIGTLLAGGLTVDLTHHVMHAIGSRMFGFSQELFGGDGSPAAEAPPAALDQIAQQYPHIAVIVARAAHDEASVVGSGCDDQFEFEFSLDLLLDGFERLHRQGWTSLAPDVE